MSGVYGASLFYANRESKQDLDIEKITIENCIDGEQYRWALTPCDDKMHNQKTSQNQNYYGGKTTKTMFTMRYRDKFVIVSEAPWQIFDHMELDIFPSEIVLTRNLYKHFKKFAFEDSKGTEEQKHAEDDSVADKEVAKQEKKY